MVEWTFAGLLGIYLAALLVIGWKARSRSDPEDFFIASRSLSHRSVAFTIGATVVGGSAVIVTGSLVFAYGLSGLWYDIGGIIGLLFLGIFVAPKLRKTRAHSLPLLSWILPRRSIDRKVASNLRKRRMNRAPLE